MWQLEMAAMKASSGSTFAGFDQGTGTIDGDGEAGTVSPPSNIQVCSREYLPSRKSGPAHFQLMVALCSDMGKICTVAQNKAKPRRNCGVGRSKTPRQTEGVNRL
jgi:hypothetical protein